jgi:hypothetical protein
MSTITSVFEIQTGVITKKDEETVEMPTVEIGTPVNTEEGRGKIVEIIPLPAVANEKMLRMFHTEENFKSETRFSTVICKINFDVPYMEKIFSQEKFEKWARNNGMDNNYGNTIQLRRLYPEKIKEINNFWKDPNNFDLKPVYSGNYFL